MKNTFHHRLNIPVKFTPVFLEDAPVISNYDTNLINKEFLNWIESLNLEISGSELFHLKPNNDKNPDSLPIHLDTGGFDNHIKLNFVYCNTTSKMNWFTCNDISKLQVLKTPTDTEYTLANAEDCELVYSAQIGQPSLVNAGMLHSVSPVESERYCFSFTLIKDGNIITWEQAEEIFKEYVSLV